jgi:pimeloyl-ACP methyl ester carboxylesterase
VPVVEARGRAFHVQELGPEGAPGLVLLHGLFVGSIASWYFTAAPRLAAARRVRMYDLVGHGKSERVKSGYDLARMAADLEALAEGWGPLPLDIAGHSYGALVALRFALNRPDRVRRLALVEAPLPPSRFDELDAFLGGLQSRSADEVTEALPEALRGMLTGGGRRATRFVEALGFLAHETTLLDDLRSERDIPDETLADLRPKLLCVYGDRSICLPVGERLARVVPGARLVTLSGGHYLHLDATAALTAALAEHFDA